MPPETSPETIAELLQIAFDELTILPQSIDLKAVAETVDCLSNASGIFCLAAGRSRLIAAGFAMRLTQIGKKTYLVGDAVTPAATESDLLFILSGSGTTESLIPIVNKAKKRGVRCVLLTYSAQSLLARLSDVLITIHLPVDQLSAGKLVSKQILGTRFDQMAMLTLDTLALTLAQKLQQSQELMAKRHANLE